MGVCALLAIAGASTAGVTSGLPDAECWQDDFNEDFCCGDRWGLTGNPACWNEEFTYLRCCGIDKLPRRPDDDTKWEASTAGIELEDGGEYDFIVVGAGSAGSAVASRLAAADTVDGQPWRVLILEAGSWSVAEEVADPDRSAQKKEAWWPALEVNWSVGREGRTWTYATGRGVGGTASVNSMIYTRGSIFEYEAFGWSVDEVLSAFKNLEAPMEAPGFKPDPHYHRPLPTGGLEDLGSNLPGSHLTLVSAFPEELPPLFRSLIAAFEGIRVPFRVDPHGNATNQGIGGMWRSMGCGHPRCQPTRISRVTAARGRPRSTTYKDLAAPFHGSPAHRLETLTHAFAERISFDGNQAVGVEISVTSDDAPQVVQRRLRIRAKHEVIIAAGVLATPKLLTLSGVAEPKELARLGVPVIASSPSVGRHFHEHVGLSIVAHTNVPCPEGYHLSEDGHTTTHLGNTDQFIGQLYAFLNATDNRPGEPGPVDAEVMLLEGCLEGHLSLTFTIILLQARTRGRLVVQSRHPMASPHLDYKPLSNSDDIQVIANTIRLLYQGVFASEQMAPFELGISPGVEVVADFQKLAQWIRANIYYYSHPTGLGADPDASEMDLRQCFLRKAVEVHPATLRNCKQVVDVCRRTWVCEKSVNQVDEQSDAKRHVLPDSQVTPTTVACGMAVSAGLLAAGCVASAAGYPALGMALINVLSSIPGDDIQAALCSNSSTSKTNHNRNIFYSRAPGQSVNHDGPESTAVVSCRHYGSGHFRPHRPVNGAFHNEILQLKVGEAGTYGSYGLPRVRLLLQRSPVLHGRDKWDSTRIGRYFSFNSDIYMPDLSTCGVRRCRFRDTSHANRNKVFDVRTPNVPVSSRVGQRYGRRTPSSYASSSDWWPGDILFLDWEAADASDSEDLLDSDEEDSRVILPGDTIRVVALQGASGRLGQVLKAPTHSGGNFQVQLFPPPIRRSSARLVSVKKENLQLANVARSGSSSADNDKSSHRQPLKTPCPKESTCPRTCSENVPLSTTEFL
ncbi:betA [Symbiodinium microadriaticum]|nr:betA [Symbiodinium microadriaticum]